MCSNQIETEAKFIVPDASTFAALQQITRLGDFALEPGGTRTVQDRYLDTPDQELYRTGFACRIRTVGEKQILTLKSLTPASGSLHRRREIEMEIETDRPRAWPEGEAKRLVLQTAGEAPLQTLFNLHQTRHKFQVLHQSRSVIEFSLDEVSLDDATSIDYYELEAELLESGTEADLIRFVDTLKSRWPLEDETRSKFERALARISDS